MSTAGRASAAAAATQPRVAAAASELLSRGNAVDAVCGAVLMAAALDRSVLLGPMHVLVAGPGLGLRCVDGRLRQPGRGAPRPRGFVDARAIPPAARVAVPALPAAVATALSMFGTVPLRVALEPAMSVLGRKDPRRVALAALGAEGAAWLGREAFSDAMVAVGGRLAGGLITLDDLRLVRSPAVPCTERDGFALAPLDAQGASPAGCHAVCAVDRNGGVAAACYEVTEDGVILEAFDLLAPLRARPVLRGERRVEPGAPLPCASTVALVDTARQGRFDAAIGLAGRALPSAWSEPLETLLSANAPAVGVVRGKRARAYSFTP